MPSVGTSDTARIAVVLAYPTDANTFENTFYLNDPSGGIFADAVLTLQTIQTHYAAHILPYIAQNVKEPELTFEDVRTVPFGGVSYNPSGPPIGGYSSNGTMPSCTALAVTKHTGALGRSGRGRWYFPVFVESMLSAPDTVASGFAAGVVAALEAFQVALETALSPAEMGFVSYHFNGAPRAAGLFQHITSWGTFDLSVDTQRRRLIGHNRHH
jgi:hypothetical protein